MHIACRLLSINVQRCRTMHSVLIIQPMRSVARDILLGIPVFEVWRTDGGLTTTWRWPSYKFFALIVAVLDFRINELLQ